MNTNTSLKVQIENETPVPARIPSQKVGEGNPVCAEKLMAQSLTPEQLSPAFLAACHCSTDANLLDQELEFLWEDSGAPGKVYEVYLGKISRNPIVKSQGSGKYFVLPWSVIINLAVERGVDK